MSRIHEALKKAAQERSVQLAKSGDATFVELAADSTAPVVTEAIRLSGLEVSPVVPPSPAAEDLTYLRYEDLITGRVDLGALGARLGLALRPALALDVKAGAAPTAAPLPRAEATRVNALTAHGRAVFGIGDWA